MTTTNKFDSRQTELRAAQPMLGSAAKDTLDTVFPKVDSELAKLFEDRNVLLADGGVISVNAGATSVSFTSALNLHINSKVAGGSPVIISLGATTRTLSVDGRMLYAVIDRIGATATVTDDASSLPSVVSANQEVYLIAKRIGTSIYFRNGVVLEAGQSSKMSRQGSEYIHLPSVDDSSTTGSAATLTAFTTGLVRVTNASLTSLAGIPAALSGQQLTIENQTGVQITINNDDSGASVGNRIYTGTNSNVPMPNNATFVFTYDSTASHWMLTGGSGSGSGSGSGKNYLATVNSVNGNGDFELGTAAKWSLFNTTLTNGLPSGSISAGASSITTFGAIGSGQLAGNFSLQTSASSAWASGEGFISDAFTIDLEDQAKAFTIRHSYEVVSGASNLDFSGTSTSTLGVAIYDVTNASWIIPTTPFNMLQGSGVGKILTQFQTSANGTQYRLAIFDSNASSGAVSLYWDSFFVGPTQFPGLSSIETDLRSDGPINITATSGSITKGATIVDDVSWARRGQDLHAVYKYEQTSAGSGGTGYYLFKLPAGLSFDSSVLFYTANDVSLTFNNPSAAKSMIESSGYSLLNTSTDRGPSQAFAYDSTHFRIANFDARTGSLSFLGNAGFDVLGGASAFTLHITTPIQGWSSSTQIVSEYDGRAVILSVITTTNLSPGAGQPIPFGTILKDSHGTYNPSTGQFTAPISGMYRVSVVMDTSSTDVVNVYKNGIFFNVLVYVPAPTSGTLNVYCNAGDIITVNMNTNITVTYSAGIVVPQMDIELISGAQQILAGQEIAASYYIVSGTSYTNDTPINFDTKEFDTTNSVTTGSGWKFISPLTGFYLVTVNVTGQGNTGGTAAALYKNGTILKNLSNAGGAQTGESNGAASVIVQLNAGEYVDIRASNTTGTWGAQTVGSTGSTTSNSNWIMIKQI